MIYTKYMLIEQIQKRLNGGNPSTPASFWDEEIALYIGQTVNARLKTDFVTNTLSMGETIPEGSQLFLFEGDTTLPLKKYGDCYNVCTLPVLPIKLIRDMGVNWVAQDGDFDNGFIWVPLGSYSTYKKKGVINESKGQVAFSTKGMDLIIYKDLLAINIEKIMVALVYTDVFSLGDYDPLPITAEMYSDIIEEIVQKLSNKPRQDKKNDVTTVE